MSHYKDGEKTDVNDGLHSFSIKGGFLTVSSAVSKKENKLKINNITTYGTRASNAEVISTIGEYDDERIILNLKTDFLKVGKTVVIYPNTHTYEEIDTTEHYL